MILSIVTTLYHSSRYIDEYHSRISKVAKSLVDEYEIILVDDGSPDDSLIKATKISEQDSRVKVVELSKNFGHHRAMMTGLEYSSGDYVFLIDCDLEEKPESLIQFWSEMQTDIDVDMVYGVLDSKTGSFLKKQASLAFYKMFNFFSSVKIPENELVSRLMKKEYVKALLSYKEKELFIPGIWADVGFNRKPIASIKDFDGFSSYSLVKRISMATDAITSFSTKPLIYIFYMGLLMSMISLIVILYLIANKFLFDVALTGWTSLLASIYLIGGIIVFSIGVIGIYLSRIFSEVKKRPNSIIRRVHQTPSSARSRL